MRWLISLGYLAGFLITARLMYCLSLDSLLKIGSDKADGEDRAMSAFIGTILAVIWPVTLAFALMYVLIARKTPGEKRREVAERTEDQEKRIQDLERLLARQARGEHGQRRDSA